MVSDFRILYFGCVGESGHYLWSPGRAADDPPMKRAWHEIHRLPWGQHVDTGLCPTDTRKEGIALHHVAFDVNDLPWTAVSFWDSTVDKRPGSCSVFIVEGAHTAEQVIALSREAFPTIWARFTFPVEVRS